MTDRGLALCRKVAASLVEIVPRYFFERPLEEGLPPLPPPAGATCEFVTQDNVGRIYGWLGDGGVWRFRRLLNRGDIGLYVLANGEVVHYSWAALKLPGHTLAHAHDPIEVGDALLHRGYTREEYRGQGMGGAALVCLLQHLRERYQAQGLGRVCALVRVDNRPPQHVFARLGFRRTRLLEVTRLLDTCFFYRGRDLAPDGTPNDVPARVWVRFKVPEILWDARLPRLCPARR